MKGLPTLIRVHKLKLEEQQRNVAELESLKQDLVGQISAIEAEVAEEGRTSGESLDVGHVLGSYVQASRMRCRHLEGSIAGVQIKIDEFREQVSAAFQELKRFELVLEHHIQRDRKAAGRRDRNLEDELGINMFRRRQA